MGNRVIFEEDSPSVPSRPLEKHLGMAGLVMKFGLARTPQAANIVLVVVAVIAFVLAGYFFYITLTPSQNAPVDDPSDPALQDQRL